MDQLLDQIVNFFDTTNVITMTQAAFFSICLDSLIEWAAHRYPMHKEIKSPLWQKLLPIPVFLFKHHVKIHHKVFDKEHYYRHGDDKRDTIAFPFWVGPLLIALAVSPFFAVSWTSNNWIWFTMSLVIAILYYIAFESLHQLEHMDDKPAVRWIRNSRIFKWLNTHHEIHHSAWNVNFNLVCPLADLLMGTYISEAEFMRQLLARKAAKTSAAE